MDAVPTAWRAQERAFLACHQRLLDVELHLLTTPLGLYAALAGLGGLHPVLPGAVVAVTLLGQAGRLPAPLWRATAVVGVAIAVAATVWPLGPWWALGGIAVAWLGQEAAHALSGEATYQSTYQGRQGWIATLAQHTVDLLPLVLRSADRPDLPFLSRLIPRDRVVQVRLDTPALAADLDRVRDWVLANLPTTEHTTHWWAHALPPDVHAAFDRIAHAPALLDATRAAYGPGWEVEVVHPMNEIYVTGPSQDLTSDTVFYMPHVDGPYALFPGAAVHRCMVGVNANPRIRTHFPLADVGGRHGRSVVIDRGDAVSFDFHRELHFITADPGVSAVEPRINLKIHHVTYPAFLRPWGRALAWLSSAYNIRARRIFLDTIAPRSLGERAGAALVVGTTRAVDAVQRFVGLHNAAWAVVCGVVSLATGSALAWVVGVSFLHYGLYIAAFRDRTRIAYGAFLRDAVALKTLSMGTLAALYLQATATHGVDLPGLALAAAGFGLAGLAAARLGTIRTYFGVELGLIAPQRITAFPYGTVPHPMILGAVVGLLGLFLHDGFRAAWPWLVPVHVGLYALHLLQEIRDDAARDRADTPRALAAK